MATIYNSDLTKAMIEAGKLATGRDKLPTELAEKIIPVINVNPRHNKYTTHVYSGASSATGSLSVAALPTGKEFYITYIIMSYVKDAACDAASGRVTLTYVPKDTDVTTELADLPVLTLTADGKQVFLAFPYPLRCRSGSSILSNVTFAAGTMIRNIKVGGYFVELG